MLGDPGLAGLDLKLQGIVLLVVFDFGEPRFVQLEALPGLFQLPLELPLPTADFLELLLLGLDDATSLVKGALALVDLSRILVLGLLETS